MGCWHSHKHLLPSSFAGKFACIFNQYDEHKDEKSTSKASEKSKEPI